MHTLKRQAIVPYTQRQMFELVNAIEEYPRFLPWCGSAEVLNRTEQAVVASVEISWSGIRKQFTTMNQLNPYGYIEMKLLEGPLKRLDGRWGFTPLEDHACKVTLDMEFEFTGALLDRFFQPIFQSIANNLVDAFCKRAVELYGTT